uniref:UDP-arabinose 4-epimerase n=1 Tax=Tetraselmis sp. GSL018 TaxID=582737 RepID=A0A061S9U6_9CHLO|mmetsp:Transcript_37646/g.89432  ORF Transcript_37646/g.89432 Transcript_37646/m.89432 type:complete len:387 (+) Transcript_37646:311-1471(+)
MPELRPVHLLVCSAVLACLIYYANFGPEPEPKMPIMTADYEHAVILVTGAAGFIGSHTCLQLLSEGHTVIGVDNLSRGNIGAIRVLSSISEKDLFLFRNIDLGNKEAIEDLFRHQQIDVVMHFAAIAYVGESVSEPLRYYHNVTSNTVFLLEAMQKAGVKQLVFSSSCSTYGGVPQSSIPVTENTPTAPNNPYGWSKWMAERAIMDHAAANKEMRVAILRYFNVYGSDPEGRLGEYPRPELRHHGRISNACLDAALGHVPYLTITGAKHPTRDGTCIRDFIHVTDLAGAHAKVMDFLANPPVVYNVGTGRGVSVREFVDACIKVTGKDIDVRVQQEPRPGDYPEMWAVPKKITAETGWSPRYLDIKEGLAHAWQWRQSHPNGYDSQ